ncbi:protein INCREASED RESISTANCE TO MYZUS PERSICAE 1-like [Carex rostrata]
MLGKRARQAMKRTTSMKEFSLDPSAVHVDASQPSDPAVARQRVAEARRFGGAGSEWLGTRHVSGHRTRRNSADFVGADSAPFLRACGLCKRNLGPGRDTYMYRGEVAFCSLECRQQQMNLDERIDKCALTSGPAQAASDQSANGETVAAA